ncbi:transposase [Mesorhizobium sp. M8A.F.Ca.ET.207.01.1.1]|uniref:transposase n=1 Tax=Mesorhizobium sp. M8A.F.Ca.ET.207.01.1.1 TaxID=2563968 RepID=UPI001FEF2F26|nr:transposase [Mesorhizobium sp. M8A.F.Ca.ET.207.01.1.1]
MRWVHAGSINRDHLDMLVSIPPNLSVSLAVQHPRGAQFAQAAGASLVYCASATGPASMGEGLLGGKLWNVTDEMWTEYIKFGIERS